MVSRILSLMLLLLVSVTGWSQIDTEFWFAPPEVSSGHGDRPIWLKVSTQNQPATIKVFQPARNNLLLASVSIGANSTSTIDLTSQIVNLEPVVADLVQKNGLRIVSTAPITAYYDIGAAFNTDIFALKGVNALGNRFIIPAQNFYNNSPDYSPTPIFTFDIVATKNNTVVKIKPTRPIYGHGMNEFTIKLNAGETYSLQKTSLSALDNPVGTVVESNKPIAITLKDDSVILLSCRDLLGDQLVPVQVAGQEYAVLKGFITSGQPEFVFITGIENNTQIEVTSGIQTSHTIQSGELLRVQMTSASMYIKANKAIYVIHVTGFGCELGMAVLPSINCRGSNQIGFSRSTNEFFGLNVLVRKEGISHFTLNGSASLISGSSFLPVPGTGDKWYAAQLSFPDTQVPVNASSLIANSSHSFQIGIINGNQTSSCRYGYFSAFSTLFIGDDFAICEGESAILDAGPDKETYLWSNGSTSQAINTTQPGKYWVKTIKEECVLSDTIVIQVKKGNLNLGPDVTICEGDEASINGKENFSWLWSDGSKEQFLKTKKPGKYWVSVFDYTGCQASDTILVFSQSRPFFNLGPNITKCPDEVTTLDATTLNATYTWDNGATSSTRSVNLPGTYWCILKKDGCTSRDTVIVSQHPGPPQKIIEGSETVCPGVEGVVYSVSDTIITKYQWTISGGIKVGGENSSISVNWGQANNAAGVQVEITDLQGCKKVINFPVRVNKLLTPSIPAGPDNICSNLGNNIKYTTSQTNGSVYEWGVDQGDIIDGQGTSQVHLNWQPGVHSIWVKETSVTVNDVCAGTSEPLKVYVYNDPSSLKLNSVSVNANQESRIDINWSIQNPDRVKSSEVNLYKRKNGVNDWTKRVINPSLINLFDPNNETDNFYNEYYLEFTDLCQQLKKTVIQNSLLLYGVVDSNDSTISLTWNPYLGWENGVDHYEILARYEDSNEFKLVQSLSLGDTQFTLPTTVAFNHHYKVMAIEKLGTNKSLSNSIDFTFNHQVYIPNVITPNSDNYNNFFVIKNIHLFPDNKLFVYNRWGKKVYEEIGYSNTWDGNNLEADTYFYVLKLNKANLVYKGTLSIVR